MTGLSTLEKLYTDRGGEFLEKLFAKRVRVIEKIDGSTLSMVRDPEKGLLFYKRNSREPISSIDRLLMVYYDQAILYMESLPGDVREQLPPNYKFSFEYVAATRSHYLEYDKLPKNHLILTHITATGPDGEVSIIDAPEVVRDWAYLLNVDIAPVYFDGFLSEEQKHKIYAYISTPFEDVMRTYGAVSFSDFVIGILDPSRTASTLQNSLEGPIEGLIFEFIDDSGESEKISAKLIDPVFLKLIEANKKFDPRDEQQDILRICLIDFIEYVLMQDLKKIPLTSKDESERYLGVMCGLFTGFMEYFGEKYDGVVFPVPEYMTRKEFQMNVDFIPDEDLRRAVANNATAQEMIRMFVAFFRTGKRKSAILPDVVLAAQRDAVERIWERVRAKVKESRVPIESRLEPEDDDEDDDLVYHPLGNRDLPDTLFFGSFVTEADEKPAKLKKVAVFLGKFQPIHSGHLEALKNTLGKKESVIFVQIQDSDTNIAPFDSSMVMAMIKGLQTTHPEILGGFHVPRFDIYQIVDEARKLGYQITKWIVNEDLSTQWAAYTNFYNRYVPASKKIDVSVLVVWTRGGTRALEQRGRLVREYIRSGNYAAFADSVPPEIKGFYSAFRTRLITLKNNDFTHGQ